MSLKRELEGNADAAKHSIDCLNLALISDTAIDRVRCRAILQSAGHRGFALSDGFIGPSLAASRESLAVITAGGNSGAVPKSGYHNRGTTRVEAGDLDARAKPSNAIHWRVAKAVDTSNVRRFGEGQQNVYIMGTTSHQIVSRLGKLKGM